MDNKYNDTMNLYEMNLYEILRTELEKKGKDWSLIEKALYIYFRTCQCFNYDETYYGGNRYTADRKFDMTKINDYKLVCTTWSYLYKDLVEALLSTDENYKKTAVLFEDVHSYINVITKNGETLLLDPVSPGGDFLAASRGFDFEFGLGKGIIYFEDNNINDEKTKEMLDKVIGGYTCNYLDYLKVLEVELKQKYHTNNLNTLTNEELNEVFVYLLTTANFKDLGIIEANELIYKSLLYLLNCSLSSKGFSKDEYNGNLSTNAFYDLTVPKNDTENEVYRLTRKGSRDIAYKKVKTYNKDWDW